LEDEEEEASLLLLDFNRNKFIQCDKVDVGWGRATPYLQAPCRNEERINGIGSECIVIIVARILMDG
jgi:hypothetical protein